MIFPWSVIVFASNVVVFEYPSQLNHDPRKIFGTSTLRPSEMRWHAALSALSQALLVLSIGRCQQM